MPLDSSRPAWSIDHQLALAELLDQAIDCSTPIANPPSGSASAPEGGSAGIRSFPANMAKELAQTLRMPASQTLGTQASAPATVGERSESLDLHILGPTAHCLPPLPNPHLPRLLERLHLLRKWLVNQVVTSEPPGKPKPENVTRSTKTRQTGSGSDTTRVSGDWLAELWSYLDSLTASSTMSDSVPPPKLCRNLQAGLIARVTLLQERLLWTESLELAKLASLKRLAYGASHEINNPLANIATRAQTLLPYETDLQRRQTLQTINAQAFRAFDMLANLMHYAAPPPHRPQRVDVGSLVQENVTALRRQLGNKEQDISLELPELEVLAFLDPHQFGVLVQALVRNAVEAVAGCSVTATITVRLSSYTSSNGDQTVLLDVLDSGTSPAPEALPYLCDPFYSGREAGRGLGFGLAKALRIVEAHGGHLTWYSPQPTGFHIRAILPQPR